MTSLLAKVGSLFRPRPSASDSYYTGASRSHSDLARWRPFNVSAQGALTWERDALSSRLHDLARNDGWAAGGVTRLLDTIIGAGWRLNAMPNWRSLGITWEAAQEIAQEFEAYWQDYANDPDCWCDAGRRLNAGGVLALAFRHFMWDGEALGIIHWLERGGPYATAVQIIDPDRLSTPAGRTESQRMRAGVELGRHGEPVAYHIRVRHPGDDAAILESDRWERVSRETRWGRRIVLHHYEPDRSGQVRGVSKLAPVVHKLRMLGRYDQAELQSAVLNAVMAAFVETPFDHDQMAAAIGGGDEVMSAYQQERLDYWSAAPVSMEGVKLSFLYPGEKVNFNNTQRPASGHETFVRSGLRNIAAALGTTYEQLSMDWGQVNYSSARAALLEVYRGYNARAGFFEATFVAPWYCAVLEEGIETGRIRLPAGMPAFQEAKAAYCAAKWLRPGLGWVDPLKEANAAAVRIQNGLSTLQRECAEQGLDVNEVLDQLAREKRMREERGLAPAAEPAGNTEDSPADEPDET